MKLFMQNFDTHVQLQEENYLVQHEDSKRHGKLKGKHLRHALNWHNLINAHAGTQFDAWPTCLSVEALQAAELIGQHCEKVAAKINIFAASLKNTTQERPPQPPPAEAVRQRTHGALISELRTLPVGQLLDIRPAALQGHILPFLRILLTMHTLWLDSTLLRSHSYIRDNLGDQTSDTTLSFIWRCLFLLESTGVGAAGISANVCGPKRLFAIKQPLPTEDCPLRAHLHRLLLLCGVETRDFSAHCQADLDAAKPASAPRLTFPAFDPVAAAAAVGALQALAAWRAWPNLFWTHLSVMAFAALCGPVRSHQPQSSLWWLHLLTRGKKSLCLPCPSPLTTEVCIKLPACTMHVAIFPFPFLACLPAVPPVPHPSPPCSLKHFCYPPPVFCRLHFSVSSLALRRCLLVLAHDPAFAPCPYFARHSMKVILSNTGASLPALKKKVVVPRPSPSSSPPFQPCILVLVMFVPPLTQKKHRSAASSL